MTDETVYFFRCCLNVESAGMHRSYCERLFLAGGLVTTNGYRRW